MIVYPNCQCYTKKSLIRIFLRGRVKFPIGGNEALASKSVTRAVFEPSGGSGANPEPTVKVWMREGILGTQSNSSGVFLHIFMICQDYQ